MTAPPVPVDQGTSTRPYLIRALHEWCTDNGFTPYIAVFVDGSVSVPMEYVKNQEIVLNVGFEATSGLRLGNELIEFKARFGGSARDIAVPIDHVVAIYARENGQGMAFPAPPAAAAQAAADHGGSEAAPPAEAARGLRLAATPESPASAASPARAGKGAGRAEARADQDRPDAAGSQGAHGDDDPTPPPEPAGGGRPALKRIK